MNKENILTMIFIEKYRKGQSLIEVVVAVGIVLVLVTGLVVATTFSLRYNQRSQIRTGALSYAKEGLEYIRQLRDLDWNTLPTTGTYCLEIGETTLEPEPGGDCPLDSTSGLRRVITVSNDDSCRDPACKKITAEVSWPESGQMQSVTLSSYITNWRSRQ